MIFDVYSYCTVEQVPIFEELALPVNLVCYPNAGELLKLQLLGSLLGEDTGFFEKVLPGFAVTELVSKYREEIAARGPLDFFKFIGAEKLNSLEKKLTERFKSKFGTGMRFASIKDLQDFLEDADVRYVVREITVPQGSLKSKPVRFSNSKTAVSMILLNEYPSLESESETECYKEALRLIFKDRFTSNVKFKFVIETLSSHFKISKDDLLNYVYYYLIGHSTLSDLTKSFLEIFTAVQEKFWEVPYERAE